MQLMGLSLGYATAEKGAVLLFGSLSECRDVKAQAFVLRVVDIMLPAARSVADITLGEEVNFAGTIQHVISGAFPTFDAAFIASLREKWSTAAMMQMRRERRLLDASEKVEELIEGSMTRWRADIAEHGLKHCALPSCDKRAASVQQ